MTFQAKLFWPALLFLLTLAFGFLLSRAGKPYNGLLFNVHKLLALGGAVVAVSQGVKLPSPAGSSLALLVGALILAALCVVALFASGALMSAGKLDYALLLAVHRAAPVLLVIVAGLTAYWLWRTI